MRTTLGAERGQMTDDSKTSPGTFRKFMDSLYVRVPELVLASVGGFGVLIFSLWLGNRDILNRLSDVDAYIATDRTHMEQLNDCVKRVECEAVRAILHAHELRVTKLETELASHQDMARERIDRINELEREVRRVTTQPTARPDPFTGSEGRVLRDQIETLQRQMRDMRPGQDRQP